METADTPQPKNRESARRSTYVAIVVIACAAAAALGFLARAFVGSSDGITRLLPSVHTILFVRSTDLPDLQRWTHVPLVRGTATGSGSTASGASLLHRVNAFHATLARETDAFARDSRVPPTAMTIALLQTATTGVSQVSIAEYSDEATAIDALEEITNRPKTGRTETNLESSAILAEVRPAHIGKHALAGFATRIGRRVVFSRDQAAVRSVLSTSQDRDLSLSASRVYSGGRLPEIPGLRAYVDYPKAAAIAKSILQSERAWRDVFTLLSPLEQNVSGIHLALSPMEAGYRLRMRIMATAKIAEALLGSENDRRAPAFSSQGEILGVAGYDLLHGYQRFAASLGTSEPDSQIVLEALSRYLLSTYVSPRLAPSALSDVTRGGYAFSMVETGSGSLAASGWVGVDAGKVPQPQVAQWFSDFVSDSRLMFTERSRPMRIGSGENVAERYLAPLRSEKRQSTLEDGTILHSAETGGSFSPTTFLRDGRLFFATERGLVERLKDGERGTRHDDSPSGAWLLRMRLPPLLGIALGPVEGIGIAVSRTTNGLRIDGMLSDAR